MPKGITRRQWRLAALLPRCETAAEAMRQAGYSLSTIDGKSRRSSGSVGVQRATDAMANRQADTARGLLGVGTAALATVTQDLQQLDPAQRIGVGLKATELAHQLGENIEQQVARSIQGTKVFDGVRITVATISSWQMAIDGVPGEWTVMRVIEYAGPRVLVEKEVARARRTRAMLMQDCNVRNTWDCSQITPSAKKALDAARTQP